MDGYVNDTQNTFRSIKMERYSMVQDDDGHTYIINAADRVEFEKLLEGDEDGLWTRFHSKFGGNMLNWHSSGYTFTDPRTATGEALDGS